MQMKSLALALIMFCMQAAAMAQEPFFVSGILKRNGSDDVVRCVHGMVMADDATEAERTFVERAKSEFPEYTFVQVIASDVATLAKPLVKPTKEVDATKKTTTGI